MGGPVGKAKLYLLDSNDPANLPSLRGITSELYGEGSELRLTQEMLLGITGWRLLKALNLKPDVCHMNEGHTALVVLERARSIMEETGQSSRPPWPRRGRATSSLPTRLSPPGSIAFTPP